MLCILIQYYNYVKDIFSYLIKARIEKIYREKYAEMPDMDMFMDSKFIYFINFKKCIYIVL